MSVFVVRRRERERKDIFVLSSRLRSMEEEEDLSM
jgi:hypothetical protein